MRRLCITSGFLCVCQGRHFPAANAGNMSTYRRPPTVMMAASALAVALCFVFLGTRCHNSSRRNFVKIFFWDSQHGLLSKINIFLGCYENLHHRPV